MSGPRRLTLLPAGAGGGQGGGRHLLPGQSAELQGEARAEQGGAAFLPALPQTLPHVPQLGAEHGQWGSR